jgi:hypothetical protein
MVSPRDSFPTRFRLSFELEQNLLLQREGADDQPCTTPSRTTSRYSDQAMDSRKPQTT